MDALATEVLFVVGEAEVDLTHLQGVLDFFAKHLVREANEDAESRVYGLVILLDH